MIDFEYFESISLEEAQVFLDRYLEIESRAIVETIAAARKDGVNADFSVESISPFFRWILPQLKTVPIEIDESQPGWIKESDSYLDSLFDFDDLSAKLILQASYYLGESFVRNSPALSWATGNPEYAQQNQPVVVGSSFGEMDVLNIAENLFRRATREDPKMNSVDVAIESWLSKVPKT